MAEAEDDDLTDAVASLNPAGVSVALKKGADPNAKLGEARVLHFAALSGSLGNVDLLLKAGADVNGRGDCADTPLHFACAGLDPNSVAIIRRLIEAGADINAPGINGRLPLDFAARKRNKAAALIIAEAGGTCASENLSWVEQVTKKKGRSRGR